MLNKRNWRKWEKVEKMEDYRFLTPQKSCCVVQSGELRADYGPTFPQPKGVTDPLRRCGPSLRPPQGPDVRLPNCNLPSR